MTLGLEESSEWHSHGVYELLYCRKGNGHIMIEDKSIALQAGRFMIVLPKNKHKFNFTQEEFVDLKFLCITPADAGVHLSPTLLNSLSKIQNSNLVFSDHETDSEISDILDKIPDALGETTNADIDITWGRISLVLALHFKNQILSNDESKGRHATKISSICSWIDENVEGNLNIDMIAAMFGMSRSLLTKEFRKHTNTSIIEYISTRRLQKAGAMLSAKDMSITEAALESGFPSIGNFYRKFKELYGVTPTEFIKQLEM
jgi:AraC family transcriptional activator of mar-sox-rob regulon